jgi:hypothetical protein
MDYYNKYLKYKLKYLNIKSLIGGNWQSAKQIFDSKLKSKYADIIIILRHDRDKGLLKFEGIPPIESKEIFDNIFDQIRTYIKEKKDEKIIDNQQIVWIMQSYMNGTFGKPSSLENYGRYLDAYSKYKILNSNKSKEIPVKLFNDIKGLLELEEYITLNNKTLQMLIAKRESSKKESELHKKIKSEGENDKVILLQTDKVTIYSPTTEKGSIYYGRNTKWCTASLERCMFNTYNRDSPLYIIQSNTDLKKKYQIHVTSNQIMNSEDKPTTISHIKHAFEDDRLNSWLDNICEIDILRQFEVSNTVTIYFDNNLCNIKKIRQALLRIPQLETLYLMSINIPLDSLLTNLVNLKNLYIGESFNQELNSSLSTLVNLQLLEFSNYHRLLGNSLDKLVNLHTLNGIVTKVPEDVMENYRKQKHGKKYVNESLKRSLRFLPKLKTVNEKPYTPEIFSGLI